MRGSIWIAAGLLATNILLIREAAPTQPTRPAQPAMKPILVVETPPRRIAPETTEAQRLRWFWQAKHSGLHPPQCEQFDPLARLDADVDPAPGHEHVFGNRQFGVMILDAQGTLLAHMDPIGCAKPSTEDQSLSLSFDRYLIVRTRNMELDGEHLVGHVVDRHDDELTTLLRLDLGGDRKDAEREWQVQSRIVIGAHDEIEVIHHGRWRAWGEWMAVDDHCTWQIATQTSSCHRRAEERTPESE